MNWQLLLSFAIFYTVITFTLWKKRLWLLYYTEAVFGMTLFLVFFCRDLGLEKALERSEIFYAHYFTSILKIPTQVVSFNSIIHAERYGWSILSIGLECSALLEMAVFFGLVIFYPGFNWHQKGIYLPIGILGTYIINLIRVMVIVGMVFFLGKSYVFIAHAIIGRFLFFTLIVYLYWLLITKPSLKKIRAEVEAR